MTGIFDWQLKSNLNFEQILDRTNIAYEDVNCSISIGMIGFSFYLTELTNDTYNRSNVA